MLNRFFENISLIDCTVPFLISNLSKGGTTVEVLRLSLVCGVLEEYCV
jgi:hypothetical protein